MTAMRTIWLAPRHHRHLDSCQGRGRHQATSRAFRLCDAEERFRVPEHERGWKKVVDRIGALSGEQTGKGIPYPQTTGIAQT